MKGTLRRRVIDECPERAALMMYHTWLGKCLNMLYRLTFTALIINTEAGDGRAKPGSVLPTTASKTGILYHSLVKRSNTSAFHADGTGSNPVGVTICPLLLIG